MNRPETVYLSDNEPYLLDDKCIVETVCAAQHGDWKSVCAHNIQPIPEGTQLRVREVWCNFYGVWVSVEYNGRLYDLKPSSLKYIRRERVMTYEQQIEEMAKDLDTCPYIAAPIGCDKHKGNILIAEYLHTKDHRKASEVAREIFEELIDNATFIEYADGKRYLRFEAEFVAELKKKYIQSEDK